MKQRRGFISNSSSTSFIITNKTKEKRSLVDFVRENPQLVVEFCEIYDWYHFTQEEMIESAKGENIVFKPHEEKVCVFGDEDGTIVGQVFDYILRAGGSSKSFEWRFHEYHR